MTNQNLSPELFRVIDANLNRLKEGIRVVEDITRYRDNNRKLSLKLKQLRHTAQVEITSQLLINRDAINDVLRPTIATELNRTDIDSIIVANFKRTQEASRVLEELFKLCNNEYSERFKHIRYELYDIEKVVVLKRGE